MNFKISLSGNRNSCLIKIGKHRLRSLVDTGAECSLMHRRIYDQLKDKPNEVFINDAHWLVTFVHDLNPFQYHVSQIGADLENTENILSTVTKFYDHPNMTGYLETFEMLGVEISMLRDIFNSVYDSFDDYQIFERKTSRPRRSLIPVIGQLMSSLFGTVSEKDLENIGRNIRALEHNQREIIHDLDVSLSVLN